MASDLEWTIYIYIYIYMCVLRGLVRKLSGNSVSSRRKRARGVHYYIMETWQLISCVCYYYLVVFILC